MASYNYGHFLPACIDSVLTQEGVDLELIVIDDASSDDSGDVAVAYARSDERVRVLRHTRNEGYIASFNEGLAGARGEFAVKLDADDLLTPGALSRACSVLAEHQEVSFVYGSPLHFTGTPPEPAPPRLPYVRIRSGRGWLEARCRSGTNCISNPEVVMRSSAMREAGLLDPSLPHTCDFALWLKLAAIGDVGWLGGCRQACYRVHPDSMQRTVNAGVVTDLRGRRDAFEVVFQGTAGRLPGAADLRARAGRSLAREALDRACHLYDRGRADPDTIRDLVLLSERCWPEAVSGRSWRSLERRRLVGADHARWVPPFIAHAAYRRVRYELQLRRWRWTGM